MTNKNKKLVPAVYAGVFAAATAVAGSIHQLPMPPPSEYVDAESSVNVSLPTNEGRRIRLTLGFDPSPTNAVQVAFGCDADGNGDLAPEETALRVGVDCGDPMWNGHLARSAVQSEFDLSSPLTFTSAPPMVTPEDIARSWQLVEERTNCNVSYTMPEGATLATNWWVRGAYEDVKPFDFGSWRFPFGTNEYDSAWAFTWGKIRFTLADTNDAHLRCARRRDGRHCDVFH